jgi:hypothetical protein
MWNGMKTLFNKDSASREAIPTDVAVTNYTDKYNFTRRNYGS